MIDCLGNVGSIIAESDDEFGDAIDGGDVADFDVEEMILDESTLRRGNFVKKFYLAISLPRGCTV